MQMNQDIKEFRKICQRAVAVSHDTLRTILRENATTEYGKKHHFAEMTDLREYRRLPLTEYADYEADIVRMMQGEEAILTAYPVKHFLTTSGSSGKQKRIPLTYHALQQGWELAYKASLAHQEGMAQKKHLHTSVFRIASGEKETLISCAYFQYLREKDSRHAEKYIGGEELLFSKEIGDVCYVKLWLALSEPSLYSIQSIFLYDVLVLLQYFATHWKGLLQDLRMREIHSELPLSDAVRAKLLSCPMPSEAWLLQVERECEKGFVGIVSRIWKECAFVSGIGGGAFASQEHTLREFLGEIPLCYFIYGSTEALIGVSFALDRAEYICIPYSGFLEFLPYGTDAEETKWIEEVEIGKQYEVIVTNFSGLYRYRMQDVAEVVGFYGEAPILRFLFRKNLAVNIAGEKTNLLMIEKTIQEFAAAAEDTIYEYSVCTDNSVLPNRYCFFIEGQKDVYAEERWSRLLDEALCRDNPDYKDLRELGEIGFPVCYPVQEGSHKAWKHLLGKVGQSKPQPYFAEAGFLQFMRERVKPNGKES